jgi:hypothetical protein
MPGAVTAHYHPLKRYLHDGSCVFMKLSFGQDGTITDEILVNDAPSRQRTLNADGQLWLARASAFDSCLQEPSQRGRDRLQISIDDRQIYTDAQNVSGRVGS